MKFCNNIITSNYKLDIFTTWILFDVQTWACSLNLNFLEYVKFALKRKVIIVLILFILSILANESFMVEFSSLIELRNALFVRVDVPFFIRTT